MWDIGFSMSELSCAVLDIHQLRLDGVGLTTTALEEVQGAHNLLCLQPTVLLTAR